MKNSKLVNKEIVFNKYGKKMIKETLQMEDGNTLDWYYLDSPNSVIVVPITQDNEVILINQYRHNIKTHVNEFPAGYVEDGESIIVAAARELLEETGYISNELVELGKFYVMPSETNRWVNIVLAKNTVKKESPRLDEFIEKYFDISVNTVGLENLKRDPSLITGIEHGYALSLAIKHLAQ